MTWTKNSVGQIQLSVPVQCGRKITFTLTMGQIQWHTHLQAQRP